MEESLPEALWPKNEYLVIQFRPIYSPSNSSNYLEYSSPFGESSPVPRSQKCKKCG